MAKTIETLSIDLEAKSAKFQAGLTQANQRLAVFERTVRTNTRAVEGHFSLLTAATSKLQRGLIGLTGAVGAGAFLHLTKSALASANALQDTADRLGLTAEALQELRYAFAATGVESGTLEMALQRAGRRLAEFARTGKGAAKEAFEALGLDADIAAGRIQTLEELLPRVADKLRGVSSETQQLSIAQKLFDSEGVKLVNTLRQGSDALTAFREEAHETGAVMADALVAKGAQANTAIEQLTTGIATQFNAALIDLAPVLLRITQAFLDFTLNATAMAKAIGLISKSTAELNAETKKALETERQFKQLRLEKLTSEIDSIAGRTGAAAGGLASALSLETRRKDVEKLRKEIQDLDTQLGKLKKTSDKTRDGLDTLGTGLAGVKKSADKTDKAVDKVRKSLEALHKAQAQVTQSAHDQIAAMERETTAIQDGVAAGRDFATIQLDIAQANFEATLSLLDNVEQVNALGQAWRQAREDMIAAQAVLAQQPGAPGQTIPLPSGGAGPSPLAGLPGGVVAGISGVAGGGGAIGDLLSQISNIGMLLSNPQLAAAAGPLAIPFGTSQIAGGLAGLSGGSNNAQLGARIGTFLLGPLGGLLGGLIGQFVFAGPGRISLEKSALREFQKGAFGFQPDSFGSQFGPASEINFASQEDALSALGLLFGGRIGDVEEFFGTIKRFGNQAQRAFESTGLSAERANAEVLSLAASLGFDLELALVKVEQFTDATSLRAWREELGEGQEDIVLIGDLLAGVIDVATGFAPAIDASAHAHTLLAASFREAATEAGATATDIERLSTAIQEGTVSAEEAVAELHALGLALDLPDIEIDIDSMIASLEQANQTVSLIGAGYGAALGTETLEAFEETIKAGLRAELFASFFEETLLDLLKGIDLTQPLDLSSDAFAGLTAQVEQAIQKFRELLETLGLVSDELDAQAGQFTNQFSLVALQYARVGLQAELAGQLGQIGALGGPEAARIAFDAAIGRMDAAREIPLGQASLEELATMANASAAVRGQAVTLFLAQQAKIQRGVQEESAAIQEAANLRRTALQYEVTALQQQLNIARSFAQLTGTLQNTVDRLIIGSDQRSASEQFAFLERRAAALREQIAGASPAAQPALLQELSRLLTQQLDTGLFDGEQQAALFESVVAELEALRDSAATESLRQSDIEVAMLQVQEAQADILRQVDADIRAAAAEAAAFADTLRQATVQHLQGLYRQEDHIAQVQIAKLEEQIDLEQETLNILKRLAGTMDYLRNLFDVFALVPAASGFQGVVSRPQLFLAGEKGPEMVSITPGNLPTSGGGAVINIGGVHVTMRGSESTTKDARLAAKTVEQIIVRSIRSPSGHVRQALNTRGI